MKTEETNPVYIIGDIHGQFARLKNLVFQNNIKDCTLICVGDFGIGFKRKYGANVDDCIVLNTFFAKRNIVFMTIRGNHDDPIFFNDAEKRINLSHVKLLPDYYSETINGEKFLFVGGAVSIDRRLRENNVSYWSNEAFVLDTNRVTACDVLITHSAPSWVGPYDKSAIASWTQKDASLWEECMQERQDHNALISLCKPRKSYHGHFHCNGMAHADGCLATILNIEEIKEHRSDAAEKNSAERLFNRFAPF